MKEVLIAPSSIRRMDITTLRAKAAELQAMSTAGDDRQKVYNTYVKVTDEITRRDANPVQHPLLIKRSAVYKMTADELRTQVAEMLEEMRLDDPAWANTIDLLGGEIERRQRIAKRTYMKRKAEAEAEKRYRTSVKLVDRTATV